MLNEIDLKLPAARSCVAYICQNLRPEDQREAAATPNPCASLADGFLNQGQGVVVTKNHEPTALLWWMETQNNSCYVAMMATRAWPAVGRAVTRLVLKKVIPMLRKQGMEQAYCIAEASSMNARSWLERLGFTETLPFPVAGQNNEEFLLYTYKF